MTTFPSERVALSKSLIDKLPFASEGKQATVYDKHLPGFALRIGATAKTFIVYKRLSSGAPKRVTLGRYGHLTIDQARTLAQQELAKLTQGIDPNAIKKQKREKSKQEEVVSVETLEWLLDTYEREQLKGRKGGQPSTLRDLGLVRDYMGERKITLLKEQVSKEKGAKQEKIKWIEDKEILLPNWLQRPYRSITREEVLQRFDYFALAKPQRVPKEGLRPIQRTHQIVFKFLSTAFNFTLPRAELSLTNPCDVLTAYKRWKSSNVRTRRVVFEKKEGANWFNAVVDYAKHNPVGSDYILFSLIQAGRSDELANITWDKVDFELQQITYKDTKNGADYHFPLTKMALEILERRKKAKINEFVFGSPESKKHGFVTKSAKPHFENIAEKCGILVSHHDLRRTWTTTASQHSTITKPTIDFCLKHAITGVDKNYYQREISTMLKALQTVEDYFVEQAAKHKEPELESNS